MQCTSKQSGHRALLPVSIYVYKQLFGNCADNLYLYTHSSLKPDLKVVKENSIAGSAKLGGSGLKRKLGRSLCLSL